jgi:hypothetical protein
MKRIIQLLIILFLGIATFLTNGCKKGNTGPAGEQGPAGSANVTSDTYTVNSWSWSSPNHYTNLSVPAITSTNVNSAAVMVYFKGNATAWSALPYTQYDSPYDYFMGFNVSTGAVQVTWFYDYSLSSGSNPNTYYGTNVQLKVVVIPPSMVRKDVNTKNYNDVKQAYGLE